MALVNYDHSIAYECWQLADHCAQRNYFGNQGLAFCVVSPHPDELLRADYEGLAQLVFLEHTRQCNGHESLTQTDDIAYEYAASLVKMMCSDLYSSSLKLQ